MSSRAPRTVITAHAARREQQRGIPAAEVAYALRAGRWVAADRIETPRLVVIVDASDPYGDLRVITTYRPGGR